MAQREEACGVDQQECVGCRCVCVCPCVNRLCAGFISAVGYLLVGLLCAMTILSAPTEAPDPGPDPPPLSITPLSNSLPLSAPSVADSVRLSASAPPLLHASNDNQGNALSGFALPRLNNEDTPTQTQTSRFVPSWFLLPSFSLNERSCSANSKQGSVMERLRTFARVERVGSLFGLFGKRDDNDNTPAHTQPISEQSLSRARTVPLQPRAAENTQSQAQLQNDAPTNTDSIIETNTNTMNAAAASATGGDSDAINILIRC